MDDTQLAGFKTFCDDQARLAQQNVLPCFGFKDKYIKPGFPKYFKITCGDNKRLYVGSHILKRACDENKMFMTPGLLGNQETMYVDTNFCSALKKGTSLPLVKWTYCYDKNPRVMLNMFLNKCYEQRSDRFRNITFANKQIDFLKAQHAKFDESFAVEDINARKS